jgi:uncharacterized membrane protein
MNKIKSFFRTTLLGGLLVVLPVIILIFILKGLVEFVTDKIRPVTYLIIQTARLNEFISTFIAVILILFLFFIMGLAIRTRIGKYGFDFFEDKFLKRIFLYKFIKETVTQLFGTNKTLFKYAALVKLFGGDTMVIAFVAEEHPDGYATIFVPSGPAPTAGFVYVVKQSDVHKIDYPVDKAMRTIISLGKGSKGMIDKYLEQH